MLKIAITTTSFGEFDEKPLSLLRDSGFEVVLNSYGRKLEEKEVIELTKDAIGLIAGTEALDSKTLAGLPQLKVISRCGAGIDNVDLEAAEGAGIKVYNTADAPTVAVAELTIGLILGLLRKIPIMHREISNGLWKKRTGNLLSGKQVGIVGFGRIGRKVAGLLKEMRANVFYTDPFIIEKGEFAKVKFKELLKKSDIISLHLSYSQENRNLLGREEFSLMKQGAFLINASRGGIVDEDALYLALKEGRLAGAALDVFEEEPYKGRLKELDNVILTPHIGSYAKESRIEMEMRAVHNLLEGLGC
ncbi:MAG: phosphoglycerate dehydrogenase [Candidatus Omnitrophota bacterium]|nr:MAG: phosphoglycerate dehydrogenase [Candidatus Omnitrophota bacterium]